MRQELDALKRHASLLEDQNLALLTELDKFSQTDEHIKTALDRRQRILDMKESMNQQLQKSSHQIYRSPLRDSRHSSH